MANLMGVSVLIVVVQSIHVILALSYMGTQIGGMNYKPGRNETPLQLMQAWVEQQWLLLKLNFLAFPG